MAADLASALATCGFLSDSQTNPSLPRGTFDHMGELVTPLGLASLVFGAGTAAIGAYNLYRLDSLRSDNCPYDSSSFSCQISADGVAAAAKSALGKLHSENTGDVTAEDDADVMMTSALRHALRDTCHDAAGLRQQVIRSCDVLLGSLDDMAEQLHSSILGVADKIALEVKIGFEAVHRRLDEKDLDKLKAGCRKVLRRYRSCLLPLTKGEIPHSSDIERLMDMAENLNAKVEIAIDKIPMGDPRRLPLLAFRTFAVRAEVDARRMRSLSSSPSSPSFPSSPSPSSSSTSSSLHPPPFQIDSYSLEVLRNVLSSLASEVHAMWQLSDGSLFSIGTELAPVLAQYALLGRALDLSLENGNGSVKPVMVLNGTEMVVPQGDECIVFDDGLEELRELFFTLAMTTTTEDEKFARDESFAKDGNFVKDEVFPKVEKGSDEKSFLDESSISDRNYIRWEENGSERNFGNRNFENQQFLGERGKFFSDDKGNGTSFDAKNSAFHGNGNYLGENCGENHRSSNENYANFASFENIEKFSNISSDEDDNKTKNMGEFIELKKISDFVWYSVWRENGVDVEIDDLPREIPIKAILAELGAPVNFAEKIKNSFSESTKEKLKKVVLPSFLRAAQKKIEEELKWAKERGAELNLRKPVTVVPISTNSEASENFEGNEIFSIENPDSGTNEYFKIDENSIFGTSDFENLHFGTSNFEKLNIGTSNFENWNFENVDYRSKEVEWFDCVDSFEDFDSFSENIKASGLSTKW